MDKHTVTQTDRHLRRHSDKHSDRHKNRELLCTQPLNHRKPTLHHVHFGELRHFRKQYCSISNLEQDGKSLTLMKP